MDIQDVISYWQAFRAECFEMLKEGTENDKRTAEEQIPVCDDTITVLQEQAEREKGCEYCKGNALDDLVLTHDIAGSPRIALHGGNTPIDKDEKPVLCPHCGRYLGDKK